MSRIFFQYSSQTFFFTPQDIFFWYHIFFFNVSNQRRYFRIWIVLVLKSSKRQKTHFLHSANQINPRVVVGGGGSIRTRVPVTPWLLHSKTRQCGNSVCQGGSSVGVKRSGTNFSIDLERFFSINWNRCKRLSSLQSVWPTSFIPRISWIKLWLNNVTKPRCSNLCGTPWKWEMAFFFYFLCCIVYGI